MDNQDVLVYRNKLVFKIIFGLSILIVISSFFSHKSYFFLSTLTILAIILNGSNFVLLYLKNSRSSFSSYLNVCGFYGIWLYLLIDDPSLNKFLFVFPALMISIVYQNKRLVLFSAFAAIASS